MATCATTGSNNPVFDRIREENSAVLFNVGRFSLWGYTQRL